MGYRYSDREIERLKKPGFLQDARSLARNADAPIEPDQDDYEALEYIRTLMMNAEDYTEDIDGEERFELVFEIVENSIPYNNYKAAMAFSQLGLFQDDMEEVNALVMTNDIMELIRGALFVFGQRLVSYYIS